MIPKKGRVLVDFFATWCGPCKMVAKQLEQYTDEVSDVTVLKIDVDQEPELASEFNIRSIPAIFYIVDGEVVDKHIGGATLSQLKTLTKVN
tara:strand:+ start:145 stop:417 length:273 start_codon:yes stop_codon:yes gene_type:complete